MLCLSTSPLLHVLGATFMRARLAHVFRPCLFSRVCCCRCAAGRVWVCAHDVDEEVAAMGNYLWGRLRMQLPEDYLAVRIGAPHHTICPSPPPSWPDLAAMTTSSYPCLSNPMLTKNVAKPSTQYLYRSCSVWRLRLDFFLICGSVRCVQLLMPLLSHGTPSVRESVGHAISAAMRLHPDSVHATLEALIQLFRRVSERDHSTAANSQRTTPPVETQ